MQEKPIPADTHDDDDEPHRLESDVAERGILGLLLYSEAPGLWSADELAIELGHRMAVVDALAALHAAGLIHRCEGFVFPTRAATRFNALEQM